MDPADSECEGPAIKSLGSLFKLTQVFLWNDGAQVSSSAGRSKSAKADDYNGSSLVPTNEDYSSLLDMELTNQMNALGLPLSFHTNKERNGPVKGKRKGTRLKHPCSCQHPADEVPSKVNAEDLLSPANFHDKTSSSFSCISMPGQSESFDCDVAVEVDMSRCASGERHNSASCTEIASSVSREQIEDDISEAAIVDAQNGNLLICNIINNDDMNIVSSSDIEASFGSHLTGAGVDHCGNGNGAILIYDNCLEVSSVVCKDTEHGTICNDENSATWQPWAYESDSFLIGSEGVVCDRIADSNDSGKLGDWMVCWDTFYMRNYFYNIKTHASTWHPPPGMEHLEIGHCTRMDDSVALKATEECGSQNKTNPLEEILSEEKLAGQPHDKCSAEIGVDNLVSDINLYNEGQSLDHSDESLERSSCNDGVSFHSVSDTLEEILSEEKLAGQPHDKCSAEIGVDNLVSDINLHNECQSLDHSDESLERSSCNDGVSFHSVSDTLEPVIRSHERCIKAASDGSDTSLENMVLAVTGSDTKPDLSMTKKKVKRKRRQRRLSVETEEMQDDYSATIGKYWWQRYNLFSKFDDGIKMDEEGWFSVTPEPVARYQASRCAIGIIVDGFSGVGGNAIQFAQRCRHVIAIDIDPRKIDYARHNAAIYGVDEQIDFITGDFFLLAPKLKADTVFLSPPWGGPDYAKVMTYDMKTMLKPRDGYFLFSVVKEIASRVVMFLPRNTNLNQLAELALSACPPWSLEVEKIYLNGKLKAITAYFSDAAIGGF